MRMAGLGLYLEWSASNPVPGILAPEFYRRMSEKIRIRVGSRSGEQTTSPENLAGEKRNPLKFPVEMAGRYR